MGQTLGNKYIECFYGQSGSGKSESIVALIMRIHQETGKIARVAVGDGSAATYEALASAGIVELADYTIRDWPLTCLTQFCQGAWPKDVLDPKSAFEPLTPAKFATIGLYVVEGLTVGSAYVMGDKLGGFAEQAARGIKIGQDSPIKIIDGLLDSNGVMVKGSGPGTVFGGNPLSHFQHAQKRMLGLIEHSKGLPGWVIWTAHERLAEDKMGQKVVGPEVAGGALTAGLSKHFNNTLHFATAEKAIKETDDHTGKKIDVVDAEYRIYTRDHFKAEGTSFVKYKSVVRHPDPNGNRFGDNKDKALPLYFESDIPGKSIIDFYEHIREARERGLAATGKKAE